MFACLPATEEDTPGYFTFSPGVDVIKVGRKAQIIEIALSICTLCLRPTF